MMRPMMKLRTKFSTVNPEEMALFKTLSGWWHPSGPMQVLHAYNYHRVQFLKKNIGLDNAASRFPLSNLAALDVGCGAGFLSESMARLGAEVTGLDPNPTSYSQAVSHKNNNPKLSKLQYQNISVEQFMQENGQHSKKHFDIVTSMEVIEHVNNPEDFLISLIACTKPGGIVMLSTIQRSLSTWLTHIMLAEKIFGIVPEGTHHHQKFINRSELEQMMQKHGLSPVDKLELDLNWKGQFVETINGGNYLLMGRKEKTNGLNGEDR